MAATPIHCPACAHEAPPGARFCGQCGQVLPVACAACGAPLSGGQRFCSACGAPVSRTAPATGTADGESAPPAPTPGPGAAPTEDGERRHASVVFSDLSGYTALNERLDPEEVSLIMAELRAAATTIVEQHGGIVNQFVGDEIMALFGVPQAGRDDAARAVRAALALHAAVDAIGARHLTRTGVALRLHTGINTGLVIVRPCAPHQGRFGLTSDTVNTAARLLKLADAGEVVAGESTWREVAPQFAGEQIAATEVRGKGQPVRPWRVVRELDAVALAPLVGRDDELLQARSALRAAIGRGGARLLVIRGEAGIGKSRLLAEVAAEARALGAEVASAGVRDFGPARGQAAWRSLVLALLGLPPGADPGAREQVVARVAIDELLKSHLSELADVPLTAAARASYAALDAAARERGAVDAVTALLRVRCADGSLLVTIEDLHWAEPPALALLARTLAASRSLPLVVAVTTRPESDGFEAARRTHARDVGALTIDLGPLDDDAARELARRFTLRAPEIAARCVERAGGNPLFLEQLMLAAGDALRDGLPGSIQALVLARLDRLAPNDKSTLQAAAVLGQRVDPAAWRSLAEVSAPLVDRLVAAGLLRPDGDGVQFAHALIRDGAYESLLKSRRRELHLKAAHWYAGRDAGLRAEHLDRADSPLASGAYLHAARDELQRLRYEHALALAQRAEARAAEPADRLALTMLRGEALRELGRNAEALAAFEQARDRAGDEIAVALAWFEIATVQRNLAAVDAAWAALDLVQPVAERTVDVRWRSRIHYQRGNLAFARGDPLACAREHGQALELARACGDAMCEAQALSGLGDAHYAAGRMRSALDAFERCVEVCHRAGALRFAVMNRAMVGWCLHWCGDPQASLREIEAAGEDATRFSHRNAFVMIQESLGLVLAWMGRDAEAIPVNRRAIEVARDAGLRRFEVASLVGLAAGLRRTGARAEALAVALQAWELTQHTGAFGFGGPLVLMEVARNTPDAAERDALVARSESMLADGAVAHCHLWMHAEAIRLRLEEGRFDDALRHADALETFVRDEPFAWATHQVGAARALVRVARGEAGPALAQRVLALRDEARRCGLGESEAALAAALAGVQGAA